MSLSSRKWLVRSSCRRAEESHLVPSHLRIQMKARRAGVSSPMVVERGS